VWNLDKELEKDQVALEPTRKNQLPVDVQNDIMDTEDDIALAFTDANKDLLRFVAPWGRWMQWTGTVWLNDDTLAVFDSIRTMCRLAVSGNANDRKRLLNAKTVASVERLARSDRRHSATIDQWDSDDWLLNTPGGIVDLKTGKTIGHDQNKYCTLITSVAPGGECNTWESFLLDITDGDNDLIGFLQRVVGYSCTGSTKEHALFFCYGTGANGKGTLLNMLHYILSDYAVAASMDVFTESKHDRHPTELAALRGARLVVAQETDEGRKWAEAKIKALTGGDPITARFMRQDFFTFLPKFSLIIAGNHKPSLRNVDEAMRRRLHLIPFTATIPKQKRDPYLSEKLKAEAGGILQWMISGVVEYNRQGLNPPKAVIDATDAYFQDEDTLQQWIADCCMTEPDYWEPPALLFNSWKRYAKAANLDCGTQKDFK